MSRQQQHEVIIARPPEPVLAYAASASHWPEWHPSSLKVYGDSGPLAAGQRFEEDIHAGGRAGHLHWEVLDYRAGRRWQARARGNHGLFLTVTYECGPVAEGTRFIRTLEYGFESWLMRLLDRLVLHRRVERESALSLQRLRERAELRI